MTLSVKARSPYEEDLKVAKQAVETAGKIALGYYKEGVQVQIKADNSPVTEADLASEAAIIDIIKSHDPTSSIIAEESGLHDRSKDRRWIIDPIDGTRGFTRGGEYWGPLVALEEKGHIVVGAMMLPVRSEVYWASKGGGAYKNGIPLRVSQIDNWSEATLSLGETARLVRPPIGEGVTKLASTSASTRGLGDLAGVTLVLNGLAEAWIEVGVKPWDLAPTKILVEEAGGQWTTFEGDSDLSRGNAIGSNGHLHQHVLDTLT